MAQNKISPAKLKFTGTSPENLEIGQITNMDGDMFFIFKTVVEDSHSVQLKALPILKKPTQPDDGDKYLDIFPAAAEQIGLKSGHRYAVDLDPVNFPQDRPFPLFLYATPAIRDKIPGLFNAVIQTANDRFLKKECPELFQERELSTIPTKRSKPQWQRELEKSGKAITPSCSIDAAKSAGIIDNIAANLLSHGSLPDGSKVGTIYEAFALSTSEKKKDQAAFRHLFETAAAQSKIRLETLFNEGYIDESIAVDEMKDAGVTTLGKAFKLIKADAPAIQDVWEYGKENIMTAPLRAFKSSIKEAHRAFLQTFIVK
ncbi:MAG: hypothetical protein RBR86_03510 [Pseudobdellovibrionaceae bacterium]|jgi:hypothetical protein|nr:hypothetical protein [Pseudobdellovibrionaceae bacterium]